MNGIYRNEKNSSFEKTHPGCLGRMVNLFDLNIGMSTNKLLSDKPHRDGVPLSRSRSDVSRMRPSEDAMEEKVIVTELKNGFSNRKGNATPMKMLIAEEMSKEADSRRAPPNLVAKLMGLDALPQQEPDLATRRSHSRGHPRSNSDIPMSCWEQNGFSYVDPNEYKDVFEIWQQSQTGRYEEALNDKKMALVRQKFMEAKRLSTDENLRQSKQFQDALEVLSTHKDLFLKCLQEPNSMFSQHLYRRQSVPPPPEAKRITVLTPSRMADSNEFVGGGNKDRKQKKKGSFLQLNGSEKIHPGSFPPASLKYCENPTQPTRIVVLKPSLGKPYDAKAVGSPQSEPPMVLHNEDFFGDVEDDENQESSEVAKATTQEMCEKLGRHHTDETLISSVHSNGYVGDESSFNKSEIDYANGNLSDSEVMSPISRHSWDYADRLGSPYASTSFSRASHSPESSVCREAKKRLSERWAMMASAGSSQEQRHVRRSSSTLGEMLAHSEAKKADSPGEESSSSEEPKDANALLVGDRIRDENVDNSPRNLIRSKSVPVSSTEIGDRLNVVSGKEKPESPKEEKKASRLKTSFKGKVSSFFFSRNKKPVEEKNLVSETKDEFYAFPGEIGNDRTESIHEKGLDHATPGLFEPSAKASSSNLIDKQDKISPETELAMEKPIASGNLGKNQDQPSPVSVLDQPFEEDEHTAKVFPHYSNPNQHGIEPPLNSIGSNLIDKSPPIGSIARTLSWDDDSCPDTASSHPTTESSTIQEIEEEEEDQQQQEWYFFVKTLLSVSGLQDEEPSHSFLEKWHSPESPLDPSLRNNYIDPKDKEAFHEAKKRQKRSTQKLIFDCVNETLVDISIPMFGAQNCILECKSSSLVDKVWAQINILFSGDVRCVLDDCEDDNGLLVERVVRKEVVGKGWMDFFRLEMDYLGKDVEEMLLEELLHESMVELF